MRLLLGLRPTYQWVLATATGLLVLTGCGDSGGGVHKPLPHAKRTLQVALPWRDGARIPRRYTCDGANKRPVVRFAAKSFAIVMTDPDAPGGTFVHWTSWNGAEGRNSFGKTGYDGPCPPKGDSPHHYVVTVYLLRSKLGLPAGSAPEKVLQTVQTKAVASGSITGLYSR